MYSKHFNIVDLITIDILYTYEYYSIIYIYIFICNSHLKSQLKRVILTIISASYFELLTDWNEDIVVETAYYLKRKAGSSWSKNLYYWPYVKE